MTAAAFITFREGLEAFLIVGILLGYLSKMSQSRLKSSVWLGAIAAVILSFGAALLLQALAVEFEGQAEQLFEAATSALAVIVLTWMVLWMQRQSRAIKGDLEVRARAALSGEHRFALGGLAFISVFREGVETALFLTALTVTGRDSRLLAGALFGLAAAALIVFLIFRSTLRLNLRVFFGVTGGLLILIGAGLVAHTVLELQEAGWVGIGAATAWDLGWLLPDEAWLARLLNIFIGYVAAPTWLMVVAYVAYLLATGLAFLALIRRRRLRPDTSRS